MLIVVTWLKVKEIKRVLKSFMMKIQARDAKERLAMEWRLVAIALDRMFFVLYVSTMVLFFVTATLIYQINSVQEFPDTLEEIVAQAWCDLAAFGSEVLKTEGQGQAKVKEERVWEDHIHRPILIPEESPDVNYKRRLN